MVNRRWGVPLIDGGTQKLPRIAGLGNALYLIETGAMIDAGQALRMGLVQEVVPDGQALERALELAAIMAGYPWASLVNDRRAAYEGLALGLAEGIRREQDLHTAGRAGKVYHGTAASASSGALLKHIKRTCKWPI